MILGGQTLGRHALGQISDSKVLVVSAGAFVLAGQVAAVGPAEPVTTGVFVLTGGAVHLSHDLLGGGGTITGGTFSRRRWRELLAQDERAREAGERRIRDARLRRQAERRRRERAQAELRRRAREAAAADADAQAAALARSHAAQAQAGLQAMRAAVDHAAAVTQAAHAAADAATHARVRNDEDEALLLLLAA
jgi:hypothetical protein